MAVTVTGKAVNGRKAAKADNAVGEQFEASLASGVMAMSYQKAKNASAGNNKIKELKAELAIIMAEAKSKTTTTDEMVLDGVEIVSLEVQIEPGIQPDTRGNKQCMQRPHATNACGLHLE
ncbi:hypothetical protein B0H14DRAFT_2610518 [Mycena olivaceomarginata]|nr:hypothetical protein B0H14DRAFT_2610518 [Mycena olivaceomarginata]